MWAKGCGQNNLGKRREYIVRVRIELPVYGEWNMYYGVVRGAFMLLAPGIWLYEYVPTPYEI